LNCKFLKPNNIQVTTGGSEAITMAFFATCEMGDEVIVFEPFYTNYNGYASINDIKLVPIPTKIEDGFHLPSKSEIEKRITPKTKAILYCSPNNPTGTVIYRTEWEDFLAALPPQVLVVVDEAYIEFVDHPEVPHGLAYVQENRPLIGLRTFSKAYGLAGLRIGYGYGPSALIGYLDRLRSPFNVNSLAQAAALAALDDHEFLARTQHLVKEGLAFFCRELDHLGIAYIPSQANFLLIRVDRNSREVYEQMLRQGVIIRAMTSYQLPDYIRVNAGLPEENQRFMQTFKRVMGFAA